jgi:hypothetical protein
MTKTSFDAFEQNERPPDILSRIWYFKTSGVVKNKFGCIFANCQATKRCNKNGKIKCLEWSKTSSKAFAHTARPQGSRSLKSIY